MNNPEIKLLKFLAIEEKEFHSFPNKNKYSRKFSIRNKRVNYRDNM